MEKAEKFVIVLAVFLLSAGVTSGVYLSEIEKENNEILNADIILVGILTFMVF